MADKEFDWSFDPGLIYSIPQTIAERYATAFTPEESFSDLRFAEYLRLFLNEVVDLPPDISVRLWYQKTIDSIECVGFKVEAFWTVGCRRFILRRVLPRDEIRSPLAQTCIAFLIEDLNKAISQTIKEFVDGRYPH